jgi:regulatory protein YycI of two-component signal transduction system YycFG
LFTAFDIRHATNTEYLDFPIFVFTLILNLDFVVTFFNVITCPFSKTISCNKPDLNTLFNNENIAIFAEMTLTLVQGQGEEIGYKLLHTVC